MKSRIQRAQAFFDQNEEFSRFSGSRAILSGPAGKFIAHLNSLMDIVSFEGGVVGYSVTSYIDGQPVIGFDMGGTSTDVSRYAGSLEHVLESTIASVMIQAPQLDINTVAAGGGSILTFRSGLFRVGPESAGAQPGPACYKKGFRAFFILIILSHIFVFQVDR